MNLVSRIGAPLFAAALLWGGGSTAWENSGFADFARGRFEGVSLLREGRLTLAPRLESLTATGETGIWSVAVAPDGALWFGTGHRGRLYRLVPGGQAELVWSAPQAEIFAVAAAKDGAIYAGTSPDGAVYRIQGKSATLLYQPKAKYIWALCVGPDGNIYAGTGDEGKVFRITPQGQGEVWYETGQAHVTSLAFDKEARLLAGSEPNGLLYRITAQNKAFMLYDSSLPEIRSIIPSPDGSVYVAALGGSLTQKQAQAAANAPVPATALPVVTTSITVTSDSAQRGVDIKPKPEAPKPPTAETPPAVAPVIDLAGVEKAAIYRVNPDNTVDTLFGTKEENVFDIALAGQDILFSTDLRGRVYRLTPDLKTTLLAETREGETTRLIPQSAGLIVATSNGGKLFRLTTDPAAKGMYESPVHDAGSTARWGRVNWRGDAGGGKVVIRTRSGNSQRPDQTWSEWSEPKGANDAPVTSPNSRFLQYQVELAGGGPSLDSIAITYQPHNQRPVVRSISVIPQWNAAVSRNSAASATQPTSYSITITDTGDAAAQTGSGTPTQAMTRTGTPQLLFTWQADDPDSDKLTYSLWFRAQDEQDWKLLKADITDNTLLQDADTFADGRYFFRVVASDRASNPPATAKEGELVSPPVLIDQTPPRIQLGAPRKTASGIELDLESTDAGSPLRRAEYSIDAGPWTLIEAADGIIDGLSERFVLSVPALPAGEHTVVVRVTDANGNTGLAKTVLR